MSKSIMQDYSKGECYLCALLHDDHHRQRTTEEHHVFFGPNRKLSEHYGLKVRLCVEHHRTGPEAVHRNEKVRRILCQRGQIAFMQAHPYEDFVQIFGRNYLDEVPGKIPPDNK